MKHRKWHEWFFSSFVRSTTYGQTFETIRYTDYECVLCGHCWTKTDRWQS